MRDKELEKSESIRVQHGAYKRFGMPAVLAWSVASSVPKSGGFRGRLTQLPQLPQWRRPPPRPASALG